MSANPNMPPSWRDPIAEYCEWLALSHASPETVKLRVYQLRRVALELRIPPFELDTERLADWLGSKSWSRSTARSWRSTLTSFYTWAVRAGRCDSSPTERLPKLAPDQGGRKREPASDIAVAWGMRASDPRVRLMVQLGARLGMRVGEISRAAREDVIPDLLGYSLIVHGKGGKRRIVPIPDKLAEQLLAMPPGYFFPGQDNGHLSAAYVSKLVSRAMPVGQTGHMLRHRRASRAYIETGHDIRAVQELLGHASVATTQIYVAVPNEQLRRAVGGDL